MTVSEQRESCITCDELEGPGADLLAGRSHADDNGLAPALVAALQGSAHHLQKSDIVVLKMSEQFLMSLELRETDASVLQNSDQP